MHGLGVGGALSAAIFADHTFRNSACSASAGSSCGCGASSSSLSSRAASMISTCSGSLGLDRFFGIVAAAGGEAAGAGASCPYVVITHPDGGSAAVCVVAARLRPACQPRSRLRKPPPGVVHNLIGHCTLRQMRLPGAPRDSVLVYSCDEHN